MGRGGGARVVECLPCIAWGLSLHLPHARVGIANCYSGPVVYTLSDKLFRTRALQISDRFSG